MVDTVSGRRAALAIVLATSASACARNAPTTTPLQFQAPLDPLVAEGFGACAPDQPASISLDSDQPLIVIVHGCLSSGREFKKLSEVFAFHEQQSICFNYDHRRTLRGTAVRLRRGLDRLRERVPERKITVLGHSQGGLVARIALAELEDAVEPEQHDLRLVTVSSPFSGIQSARHCGQTWLHVLSLGITVAICQGIAGANWVEIHPKSRYWTDPHALDAGVFEHLQIVTDEAGSCRTRRDDGSCKEDDLVFTVDEQVNAKMVRDSRVERTEIRAGHARVVGSDGTEPRALIHALQRYDVLATTPPDRLASLTELVDGLFGPPNEASI
jgi:pimeloyl-ACP methyl ester carboxylesterase